MILGVLPARFRELFNNRLSSTKGNYIACCFEKGKTSVTIWARNKVIPCTGVTCIKAATVRPATSYFVLSKSSTLKRGASLLLKYCHMSHAYRYRLEQYSGKRERGKFVIQICLWHQLNRQPKVVQLNQIECVTYLRRAIYLSRFLLGFAAF